MKFTSHKYSSFALVAVFSLLGGAGAAHSNEPDADNSGKVLTDLRVYPAECELPYGDDAQKIVVQAELADG